MRSLFQIVLWFLLFMVLLFASAIIYALIELPPLYSAQDVRTLLEKRIEAEQTIRAAAKGQRVSVLAKPEPFVVTPRSEWMAFFIQAVLSAQFCPDYFESPPMPLTERTFHMLRFAFTRRPPMAVGVARCQIEFSRSIAQSIGLPPTWMRSVAQFQIITALSPNELFELYIASLHYDLGVFGPQEASRVLFHKPIEQLNISQMVSLIASYKNFDEWSNCREPLRLQVQRDRVLDRLEALNVVSKDAARWIRDEDWKCPPRPPPARTSQSSMKP